MSTTYDLQRLGFNNSSGLTFIQKLINEYLSLDSTYYGDTPSLDSVMTQISDTFTNQDIEGFLEWDSTGPYFDSTTDISKFTLLVSGSGYIGSNLIEWLAP